MNKALKDKEWMKFQNPPAEESSSEDDQFEDAS